MKAVAVAVYMTDNNDLYSRQLYSDKEVEQVILGTHDEIDCNYKVIIVHDDLRTVDCT